jgi:hypothetical protein
VSAGSAAPVVKRYTNDCADAGEELKVPDPEILGDYFCDINFKLILCFSLDIIIGF